MLKSLGIHALSPAEVLMILLYYNISILLTGPSKGARAADQRPQRKARLYTPRQRAADRAAAGDSERESQARGA